LVVLLWLMLFEREAALLLHSSSLGREDCVCGCDGGVEGLLLAWHTDLQQKIARVAAVC
jgi:hypothetical protein